MISSLQKSVSVRSIASFVSRSRNGTHYGASTFSMGSIGNRQGSVRSMIMGIPKTLTKNTTSLVQVSLQTENYSKDTMDLKTANLFSHVTSSSSSWWWWNSILPRSFSSYSMNTHKTRNTKEIVKRITLNNLSDNPGAVKAARRVGRGIGSSKGKTCGRGHKGQKARAGGGPHPLFEGGQTRFYRRIPKRGFNNQVHATPMVALNVGTLQDYIDMKRLIPPSPSTSPSSETRPLTIKDLVDAGMMKNSSIKHGVKLLAKGKERLRTPIHIEVSRASSDAIAAIEKVGGQVTTVHYNALALRALLKPHKFEGRILPKRARPPPKLMPYYTSYEKRGYLSPEMQLKKVQDNLSIHKLANE